jgi:hypothetical protein
MLEIVSKSVAALAIIVYASGFLITSVYHSSYGFIESDPLRLRILFAGAWFVFFLTAPLVLAWRFVGHEHWESKEPWSEKIKAFLTDYYIAGTSVVWAMSLNVFEFDTTTPANDTGSSSHISLTFIVLVILGALGAIAVIFVLFAIGGFYFRKYIPPAWRARIEIIYMLCTSLGIVVPAFHDLSDKRHFTFLSVALWFIVAGTAFVIISRFPGGKLNPNLLPIYGWALLPAITAFSTIYYPHIKSSWGGGMPIPAIISFTKDSPMMATQNVQVRIIDESSLGFYVVSNKDDKATFIPRSYVGFIHFGSDPSDQFTMRPK